MSIDIMTRFILICGWRNICVEICNPNIDRNDSELVRRDLCTVLCPLGCLDSRLESLECTGGQILVFKVHRGPDDSTALLL
jgi:hypothetical protein